MSSLVSASTPSRFAFASAALNLASPSCSTVPEFSREGTDAGVADGLCSGFFGGSGGTGLSVVGSGSLLGGLDGFTMLGLMCFGTLPIGGVGFPTVLESSREGIDADVADGLCSGFFGVSGGTGLSVVGSGSLLGGLDRLHHARFDVFWHPTDGRSRFPQTRSGQFWRAWSRLRVPV